MEAPWSSLIVPWRQIALCDATYPYCISLDLVRHLWVCAGAAAGDAMAAVGTAAPEAPASDTWPRGAAAATAAVAEPEARPDTLRLHASGHCIPHPAKVERGGEDAHFILGSYAIGVADGVGGWSKDGVDPGEYSRELMRQTAQALRRDSARSMSCVEALGVAHDSVAVPGTSTAIVARCGCSFLLIMRGWWEGRVLRAGAVRGGGPRAGHSECTA